MPDTSELNIEQMRAAAERATALLRTLAHEDRLLLLCQLSQRELCVSELEKQLDLHQPTLSQQLGILRRQELVTTRRDGKRIYYRIADPRALALLQTLYSLNCEERGTRNDD